MTITELVRKVKHAARKRLKHLRLVSTDLQNFKRRYVLQYEIGSGGFGTVYAAIRVEDGLPVAVKYVERRNVLEWGKLNDEDLPMEICMLLKCAGIAGVVGLLEYFTVTDGFLMVMERPASCTDLYSFVVDHGPLEELTSLYLFKQLVDTVAECLDRKIVHRDIKSENIIIDLETGKIKLVDFGAATYYKPAGYMGFQGTRLYCPPEWFTHSLYLAQEAAVWSMGVVLYSMLNSQLPYITDKDICTKHLLGPLPKFADYSKETEEIIEQCLSHDPFKRVKVHDLRGMESLAQKHLVWRLEPSEESITNMTRQESGLGLGHDEDMEEDNRPCSSPPPIGSMEESLASIHAHVFDLTKSTFDSDDACSIRVVK